MRNMNNNSVNKMWSKVVVKVADKTLHDIDRISSKCLTRTIDEPKLPKELLSMKMIESEKLDEIM